MRSLTCLLESRVYSPKNLRSTVQKRLLQHNLPNSDSCTAANIAASFEHCIRAQQERFWNLEAYGLRRLEIDGQLELGGLLNGYVFGLSALQNPLHELGAMPKRCRPIRPE